MATGLRQDEETTRVSWLSRRRLLIAGVLFLLVVTIATTADVLADGALRHWDRQVMFGIDRESVSPEYYAQHALRLKSGFWFWIWRTLVWAGQYWLVALLSGVAALIVAVRRRKPWLLIGVCVWIVADQGVVWLFKKVIGRSFPLSTRDVLYTPDQAFPSGHSALGASCLIVLAALLPAVLMAPDRTADGIVGKARAWLTGPGKRGRAAIFAERYAMLAANVLAIIVVIAVVMLGYHWPTDAIAGWSFGILFGLVGYGVVRRFE